MTIFVGPDEGQHLPGDFKVTIKIRSEDTGGTTGFEAACARHHMAFFPDSPWTAELRKRFGLLA
jgi:hypothetical protein